MTSIRANKEDDDPVALAQALGRSKDVTVKVEQCAEDLGAANKVVKQEIAKGAVTVSAPKSLADGEKVERKVQECADDLNEVNEALAKGIDDLKQTDIALTHSRRALAETEGALAVARDSERAAHFRAMHDSTTGLPNRDLFDDRLAQAISLAERHDWPLAVMFIDLDHFKAVNDTHGHAAGDEVLTEVARRLLQYARDEDTVCRNGGDEFLYLLMNPQDKQNIERIADAVSKNIARPIEMDNIHLVIKISIGIAVYPSDGTTAQRLITNADAAMYRVKKATRGGIAFFSES